MPRIAHNCLDTSFFHVMVQGINREYIFQKERYINRYLQLLKEKLNRDSLEIIAYCIMNNHAHLLMQVKDIEELSKYMQKVNSTYAQYFNHMETNRVGYVFRDRYKSEPILDRRQLIQCVKYIHRNPVKANMVKNEKEYKYSSYQQFQTGKIKEMEIFTNEEIMFICNMEIDCEGDFLDVDIDINQNFENLILEFIKKEKIKVFEIFEKRDIIKKLIRYLKYEKKIKYTEIMKKLEITKGTMESLKKNTSVHRN